MRQSNILDPIHDGLDARVWDQPDSTHPVLKTQHAKWIKRTIYAALTAAGYTDVEKWLKLILTGSLTTYQYSDQSDVDVSLFVDTKVFPEWSRAEMIGEMINKVDGTTLPGTPFPMQDFVVPGEIKPKDLYKSGLRSGYDIDLGGWIVPPERDRVHNVEAEENGFYVYAMQMADKMESLLRYEPDKAIDFWHQIHSRRQRDQRAGKGDYAESNVVYKFLANRGLFKSISEATGEYIAKTAANVLYNKFRPDPVHPPEANGPTLPFIYDPAGDVVHLGPSGAYHWQLAQRTPELRDAYKGESEWSGPAFLQGQASQHVHGAMSWPGKEITFLGEHDPQIRAQVVQALGGTDKTAEGFDFGA